MVSWLQHVDIDMLASLMSLTDVLSRNRETDEQKKREEKLAFSTLRSAARPEISRSGCSFRLVATCGLSLSMTRLLAISNRNQGASEKEGRKILWSAEDVGRGVICWRRWRIGDGLDEKKDLCVVADASPSRRVSNRH